MFQKTFKYYKAKCPPPDFNNVLDLDCPERIEKVNLS